MVYLTDSLHALGPLLEHLLVAYWSQYPRGLSYFALECERFLHWLHKELNEGRADLPQQARQILRRDQNRLLQEMADAITVTSRHRLAPPRPAPAAGGLSPGGGFCAGSGFGGLADLVLAGELNRLLAGLKLLGGETAVRGRRDGGRGRGRGGRAWSALGRGRGGHVSGGQAGRAGALGLNHHRL